MVGQTLPYGTGVSWAPINAAVKAAATTAGSPAAGTAAAAHAMLVQDVSERDGVHFFRGAAAAASHGSYLAVPLVGRDGQVVGLLGVDTLAAAAAAAGSSSLDAGPGVTQLGVEQVGPLYPCDTLQPRKKERKPTAQP